MGRSSPLMQTRIFCTVALVTGILTAYLPWRESAPLLAALIATSPWFTTAKHRSLIAFAALCFTIGCVRAAYDIQTISPELARTVRVEGSILDSPRRWGSASVFLFQVDKLEDERPARPLTLLVRWSGCEENLEPGDRWRFEGRQGPGEEPSYPSAYDQRRWLWVQGAQAVLTLHRRSAIDYLGPPEGRGPRALAHRMRGWMVRRLKTVKPNLERALVVGVVFGETSSLPKDLQEQFRRTGTSHLLAASGMNVALLAGILVAIGRKFGYGPWRVAPFAIPPVIFYAFLAGCAPSITRASLATTLALTASILGRRSDPWNSICLSVWGILLWDPRQLFDMGFQLSVVAVMGLILTPRSPEGKLSLLWQPFLLTCSATLATFPILWCSFGELSSTTLPSNLVLGPLVELLFPLGLLLSIAPLAPLGWVVTKIAWLSLKLVALLSSLAEPIHLTPPNLFGWCLWAAACALWFAGSPRADRLCAALLTALAVAQTVWLGHLPSAPPNVLVVRKVGHEKPLYWLSTFEREILVLSEPWQKDRGKTMLRKLGCLTTPEVYYLKEGLDLELQWREFRWSEIRPLLLNAPYSVVRVSGSCYRVEYWWPESADGNRP